MIFGPNAGNCISQAQPVFADKIPGIERYDMREYRVTENVSEKDIGEIFDNLKEYNLSKLECSQIVPLGVFVEGADGKKQAGLIGETFGKWFFVKYLWVSPALRGNGVGSRILKAAEDEARSRGAGYVFVDTFDFQAPKFYLKHGYKQVFELTEYPKTGKRHYYTKEL